VSDLVSRLPDGLDTYLERPVRDLYGGLPDGASVFGGKVDNDHMRGVMGTPTDNALSGGEMQRIAVARTFMRSVSEEKKVGLLLFDEPSASLDPRAEHGISFPLCHPCSEMLMGLFLSVADLFTRLRELRGKKTMIFSTHRFGDLTRHADLILWVLYLLLPR
jgi:ABC-type transporter Mla maintaining outer membrane lipid asymmetry ATPase subunit MlaF